MDTHEHHCTLPTTHDNCLAQQHIPHALRLDKFRMGRIILGQRRPAQRKTPIHVDGFAGSSHHARTSCQNRRGLGITVGTASRILKGQRQGHSGEEGYLLWERFPNVGLMKTYNIDKQVSDSAGTATAYLTGVKGNYKTLGVTGNVQVSDCAASLKPENRLDSILKWAQDAGKDTGLVTTAQVTHASPAGLYAKTPSRNWQCDTKMAKEGEHTKACKDIARQLVEDEPGKNINYGEIARTQQARFLFPEVELEPPGRLSRTHLPPVQLDFVAEFARSLIFPLDWLQTVLFCSLRRELNATGAQCWLLSYQLFSHQFSSPISSFYTKSSHTSPSHTSSSHIISSHTISSPHQLFSYHLLSHQFPSHISSSYTNSAHTSLSHTNCSHTTSSSHHLLSYHILSHQLLSCHILSHHPFPPTYYILILSYHILSHQLLSCHILITPSPLTRSSHIISSSHQLLSYHLSHQLLSHHILITPVLSYHILSHHHTISSSHHLLSHQFFSYHILITPARLTPAPLTPPPLIPIITPAPLTPVPLISYPLTPYPHHTSPSHTSPSHTSAYPAIPSLSHHILSHHIPYPHHTSPSHTSSHPAIPSPNSPPFSPPC
ncbi:salivary alkaline phosphatase [Penaeus vannamei]|uniref:Alkaline phosphatase n=1 Tax=Penaeus vannamei TaxID=6689 RepID=A0A3R7PX93_PENVA|nr:salivary alkaline phosphatase [Penaeus vannamei]